MASQSSAAGLVTKPSLTFKRRLNAAPEKVYAAWTDPQKLIQWFGRVDVKPDTLRAEVEGAGVRCSIGHASGGIRIRSEQVGMDAWLARLLTTLNDEAAHSEQTRLALEHIVIGDSS